MMPNNRIWAVETQLQKSGQFYGQPNTPTYVDQERRKWKGEKRTSRNALGSEG